jgi:hypothetical protein
MNGLKPKVEIELTDNRKRQTEIAVNATCFFRV